MTAAFRALGQDLKQRLAAYWRDYDTETHADRLALHLIALRAAGVDIGLAMRIADRRCAELGLDVDVPVTKENL